MPVTVWPSCPSRPAYKPGPQPRFRMREGLASQQFVVNRSYVLVDDGEAPAGGVMGLVEVLAQHPP